MVREVERVKSPSVQLTARDLDVGRERERERDDATAGRFGLGCFFALCVDARCRSVVDGQRRTTELGHGPVIGTVQLLGVLLLLFSVSVVIFRFVKSGDSDVKSRIFVPIFFCICVPQPQRTLS